MNKFKLSKKLKSLLIIASGGTLTFSAIGIYQGNEYFYKNLVMPTLHSVLNPEQAHKCAIQFAKFGLLRQSPFVDSDNVLETTLWGLKFKNPVGIAAGFDKDGVAVNGLFKTGIGFMEVGSVTPVSQDGNPTPRMFRLVEDEAVINRCGFNNQGHKEVKKNLQYFDRTNGVLGVNLGKNKYSESALEDYVEGVQEFSTIADYLVINVSSPNTPGLRDLQSPKTLENLLDKVLEVRNENSKMLQVQLDQNSQNSSDAAKSMVKPPILVKIDPDMSYEERKGVAKAITRKGKKIDGLIVSNTTLSRPEFLCSKDKNEVGGLSGKPLKPLSTQAIRDMYKLTNGAVPIVGVGGISSGKDAYEKIRAGASLVQIYSALVYTGPPVINKVKKELLELLKADGFKNIQEAVGADHR